MVRRSAACASEVMQSASSRMMSCAGDGYGGDERAQGWAGRGLAPPRTLKGGTPLTSFTLDCAKCLILCLTICARAERPGHNPCEAARGDGRQRGAIAAHLDAALVGGVELEHSLLTQVVPDVGPRRRRRAARSVNYGSRMRIQQRGGERTRTTRARRPARSRSCRCRAARRRAGGAAGRRAGRLRGDCMAGHAVADRARTLPVSMARFSARTTSVW